MALCQNALPADDLSFDFTACAECEKKNSKPLAIFSGSSYNGDVESRQANAGKERKKMDEKKTAKQQPEKDERTELSEEDLESVAGGMMNKQALP